MNKTKKSLLMSAVSLLLCISMLIGSTFAWFTDSVTSSGNKIQSGTLKVDLELLDKEGKWNSLKESQAPIFNYDKWEPGYIDTKILKVENKGNLALKWVAKFYSEKQLSILADVIDVYVCPSNSEIGYPADRNLDGYTCVGNLSTFINSIEKTTWGTLEAKEVSHLGIALKMREEAGNEYQGLSLGGAFDIRIYATQYTSESDSFGNQYDKNSLFDGFVDKSILTSQGKYISDGAESVNFSIFHKGVKIVAVSVPASAIANKDKPVTVTIRAIDSYIAASENAQSYAYDINVSNLKANLADDQLVTVVASAPKALAAMKVYHKNELVENAVYDEVAGTITFKTANFSPFEFTSQVIEVSNLAELRAALQTNDHTAKLMANITVDLTKDTGAARDINHAYDGTNNTYYNGFMINSKNVGLDLNGHSITALCGDEYNSNSDVGALFFVGKDGSLNITDTVGTGFIKMRSSIYAVWAPFEDPSYVDIYGGAFIADSYAGDPIGTSTDPSSFDGTMQNENSNRALIYAGFGGNINIYGGYYLYNNTPNDVKNRNNGAFNAKDFYNGATPLITIHEGVMLIDKAYRQDPTYTSTPNGDFDNFSIKLNGEDENLYQISDVTLEKPMEILGKKYATWYKVSRAFKYKITFMDNNSNILDTQYIMDNTNSISVETNSKIQKKAFETLVEKDPSYNNDFGGWVNAASDLITKIDAGKTTDIVLYPKHADKYTVRWLDEDGNVIHSVLTTKTTYGKLTAPTNPDSKYTDMKFSHWEVRKVVGDTITSEAISSGYSITSDITLYPVYEYTGGLNLIPVDTDGDGVANHYAVSGSDLSQGEDFVIPEMVNGIKVEEIRTGAFADEDLRDVVVPKSITYIGKNAFCANEDGFIGIGGTYPQIQIIFEGTKADWDAIQKDTDWADNIGANSNLVCLGDSTPCYYNKKNKNTNSSWDMKTGYPNWFKERYPEWAN